MTKLFLFLSFVTLLIIACSKDPSPAPTTRNPNDTAHKPTDTSTNNTGGTGGTGNQNTIHLPPPGVYVAGDSFNLSTQYLPWPVYWVNGKEVHLPNAAYASANGIVVTDSNVYTSCDGIYLGNNVTYWKDTNRIYLTDPSLINPVATGIVRSGTDLYVVGSAYTLHYENYIPIYWKNGNLVNLGANVHGHAEGHGIAVSGNDVYVAGTMPDINALGTSPPCYWKNGTVTFLHSVSPSSDRGLAKSIFVSGSDVYVVGEVYPIGSGSSVGWAVYWKNGVATELTSPAVMSQANGITVSGSDVYIAGAVFGSDGALHATYWKNGIPTTLDQKYSIATAVAVSGSDVYVAGNRSVDSALYWKNGTPVILGRGRAYAITIKN